MNMNATVLDHGLLDRMIKSWSSGDKLLDRPYRAWFALRFVSQPKLLPHETEKNTNQRYGFLKIGGGMASPAELTVYQDIFRAFVETIGEYRRAAKNNEKVVWVDWPVPNIIVRAFGVESMCPYGFMTFAQSRGASYAFSYFDAAADNGVGTDACGMNRIALGAYLSGELHRPAAIVSAAFPCDSQRTANQLFEGYADVPSLYLDAPYGRDGRSIEYFAQNIRKMIRFLEHIYGRKMDWNRLRRLVDEMNCCNQYLNEVGIMHRAVPSPNLMQLLQGLWYIKVVAPGSPHLTSAAQKIHDIARSRIKRPAFLRRKEKIRIIIWDNNIAFTDLNPWMEKMFGAVIVADYIGHPFYPLIDTSSNESMIYGIAADKLAMGMLRQSHGTSELAGDELDHMIHEYSADCIIAYSHTGCKHNKALNRIIRDIARRTDVPALFLEVDIFDKRVVSEDELKRQIAEFFYDQGLAS